MTENERFRELRKYLDFTQPRLAEVLGVKHPTISQIETGKRRLTLRIKKFLETKFSVNLKWLETGNGEMFVDESKTNTTIDRVMRVVDWLGISIGEFCDNIGYNGPEYLVELFTKGKKPPKEVLQKTVETYTQINANWLFYNEGTMFIDKENSESAKLYKELYQLTKEKNEWLEKEIKRLKERLGED